MKEKITASSGNVFADLGFESGVALSLRVRSDLMAAIHELIESAGLTQAQAAERFGVSQPRISDLVRGRIERFSIDSLIEMVGRWGLDLDLSMIEASQPMELEREIEFTPEQFEFTIAGWHLAFNEAISPRVASRDEETLSVAA